VAKFEKKTDRTSNLRKLFEERKLEKLKKYYGVNLFVKNLDDRVDSERLKKEFSAFGQITSARVMKRKHLSTFF
jgi:polyadenylate-binding protein